MSSAGFAIKHVGPKARRGPEDGRTLLSIPQFPTSGHGTVFFSETRNISDTVLQERGVGKVPRHPASPALSSEETNH